MIKHYSSNPHKPAKYYPQESSYARGGGLIDNFFGISKAAQEAAETVMDKMGDALKASAREVGREEARKMGDELRALAREAGREEANKKAHEIEKTILNSVSKTVENTAKIARETAEKAVKNVGPEVAILLKPGVNLQVEKSVKEFCATKIENLIKPEIENKISEFITEARMEKEVNSILQSVRIKALSVLDNHTQRVENYFNQAKLNVDKQLQSLNDNVEKFKCDLAETKSDILKAGAQSFHESAASLNVMADQATCGSHQDPMYF
ncbi:hypothetical protein [Wolbachia endosymbiont of Folsomia candida]|uniref:hypothetical protein n=1 Tax=Wolbachia endosymbiont of Folsomia candida TaxID=169402 RepID=UPI000AC96598|nr:hypothetical protein [Wolbachia endosymbiont of Folsomia candida]APR98142.1 hypothetical protein ASM33_02405 [Wolbachia endosymbiont of Folsomia candida]